MHGATLLEGPVLDVGSITLAVLCLSFRRQRPRSHGCKYARGTPLPPTLPTPQVNERASAHIATKSAAQNVISFSHRKFYLLFIRHQSVCFSSAFGFILCFQAAWLWKDGCLYWQVVVPSIWCTVICPAEECIIVLQLHTSGDGDEHQHRMCVVYNGKYWF